MIRRRKVTITNYFIQHRNQTVYIMFLKLSLRNLTTKKKHVYILMDIDDFHDMVRFEIENQVIQFWVS